MALSVRSARCTSKSIFFFGFIFTSLASTFAGIQLSRLVHNINDKKKSTGENFLSPEFFWKYWIYGYPILIGLWSQLTGAIGATTSKPKYSRNILQISTYFISSLILLGSESYAIYDLISDYLQPTLEIRKSGFCSKIEPRIWWNNCHILLAIYICMIILAAFIILLSLWCVMCCCGSFCCLNQVGQEPDSNSSSHEEQQVIRQPTAAQGVMMQQGAAVMVPIMYNSSLPGVPCRTVPTMQGNMQATQGNAIPMMQMAPGSCSPITGVPVFVNTAGQQ